jgi:hypothetical protein
MDPNANLTQLRALVQGIDEHRAKATDAAEDDDNDYEIGVLQEAFSDFDRMAELVLALDEWLSNKSGFLPDAWTRKPTLQVLHARHSDGGCFVGVYVDDVVTHYELEDIDPGAGYARSDWNERIREAAEHTDTTFGRDVHGALEEASDSEDIYDDSEGNA